MSMVTNEWHKVTEYATAIPGEVLSMALIMLIFFSFNFLFNRTVFQSDYRLGQVHKSVFLRIFLRSTFCIPSNRQRQNTEVYTANSNLILNY